MHNKIPQEQKANTLNFVLDIITEGVWDWNANTGHVDRSPGWYRMLNYNVGELAKTVFTWEDVIHPDDYSSVMQHFEDYIQGKIDVYQIEYRCLKSDGSYLWIKDQGKIVERNNDDSVARMIGAHLNIHDQKIAQLALQQKNELISVDKLTLENKVDKRTFELEAVNRKLEDYIQKIDKLSTTDYVTTLYNRRKSEIELDREMSRSKRYATPMSVVLFDIDNFKVINDSYGHHIGDQVLQNLSQLVKYNIRETDIFGRWGGDEFLIILPGINAEDAVASMEKLRSLIAESELITSLRITCSFGMTEYITDDSINSIYKRIDRALYSVKDAGRNAVIMA